MQPARCTRDLLRSKILIEFECALLQGDMAEALKAIDAGTALMEAEHRAGLAAAPFVPVNRSPATVQFASLNGNAAAAATTETAIAAAESVGEVAAMAKQPSETISEMVQQSLERATEASAASGPDGSPADNAVPASVASDVMLPSHAVDAVSDDSAPSKVANTGDLADPPSELVSAAACAAPAALSAEHPNVPVQIEITADSRGGIPVPAGSAGRMQLPGPPAAAASESRPARVLDASTVAREAACVQQHPVIAAEEVAFAAMLGSSLQATMQRRDTLVRLSQRTQTQARKGGFA